MARLSRAPVVRIYERGDALGILRADGSVWRIDGDSAQLVRVILEVLTSPRTEAELMAKLSELSGSDAKASPAVGEALRALRAAGVVVEEAPVARPSGALTGRRVVLALCGGIVAAHAPALAELLLGRGAEVRAAATESGARFFSPLALSALTHHAVITSTWPASETEPVPHLALAEWADIVVVYPATATTLSRLAAGDCSSIVSALALSTRAPVLLIPAMNEAMLLAPAVQRNLRQLTDDGFIASHSALGYEVARAPTDRQPTLGAAPPLVAVVDLVEAVVVHEAR